MERFPNLRRLILVADRGLLSLDNLEALQAIRLRSDKREGSDQAKAQALEFIIAVPGRRYHEFADLLEPLQQQCPKVSAEITGEVAWNGLRLVAYDPVTALEQQNKRQSRHGSIGSPSQCLGGQALGQ